MADTRKFVKMVSDLIVMTEKKLVKKEGTITESLHLDGDPHQPTRDDAARTGLGRLALQMQPEFSTDAGGHSERGSQGQIPVKEITEPKPDHGETAMGTQDPMGKDAPVHDQPYNNTYQDSMVKPPDRRGTYDPHFFETADDKTLVNAFREEVIKPFKEAGMSERMIVTNLVRGGFSLEEAYDLIYSGLDEIKLNSTRDQIVEAIKKRIHRVGAASVRTRAFREDMDDKKLETIFEQQIDESRYYASIKGHRGEATRQGHKSIVGHVRGWDTGVKVHIEPCKACGNDRVTISRTAGSNGHESDESFLHGWCQGNPAFCDASREERQYRKDKLKEDCTAKEKRQEKHIEASERKEGKSKKEAERIGYATVNKQKNEARNDNKGEIDGTLDWDERRVTHPEEFETECPACGGQAEPMGNLGKLMHYRCRNCGMWSSHE